MRIAVVLAGVIVLGSSLGVAALATGSAPSFAHREELCNRDMALGRSRSAT